MKIFLLPIVFIASISVSFGQTFDPYQDVTNNIPTPGLYDKIHKVKSIRSEFGKDQPVYGISVSKTNENGLIYNVVTKDGYIGLIMGDYLTVPCNKYTYFAPT